MKPKSQKAAAATVALQGETETTPKKFSGLTPEQMRVLLTADEKNLVEMVSKKRLMSSSQRKELRERASEDTADIAPEGWSRSVAALARALQIHRVTIFDHLKDPDHPKRVEGIGYNIFQCREWYVAKGVIRSASGSNEALMRKLSAEARKEESRATLLETKAREATGELLAADEIIDAVTRIATEAIATLRSLPSTLSPSLVGKDSRAVEDLMQQNIDDALSKLADLPWLTPDVKKKLVELGSSSIKQSVAFFARPLVTVPSSGSAEMYASEPPTPALVTIE